MRASLRFLAIFSFVLAFSTQLHARSPVYEETYHVGITTGSIDGGAEFGSVEATGFTLAARNQKASLEYINMSSKEGSVLSSGNQWEANLSGFYLALIGQGQPYIKFKVGKLKHEMITTAGTTPSSETNSITSYGLGVGYKMGTRMMLEFDVTTLDEDMTLFSLTLLF